ncbi:MAG: calcium-binding protein, partial [Vicinamibacterales bacterium]
GMQGADALFGGTGNDLLVGDNSDGVLASEHGDDYLDGGAGQDILIGDGGNDVLVGGSELDQLIGGEGDDVLYGGTGNDILLGGAGNDSYVYYRGDGVDTVQDPDITSDSQFRSSLILGPGITREQVKFRLGSLMVDLGEGDAVHFNGFDPDNPLFTPVLDSIQFADGMFMRYQDVLDQGFDLEGTEGDDIISGTAVTDRIVAKGGNDDIDARAGDDIVDAGTGDDVIEGGDGNDTITTGDGSDVVFGGAGNDTVLAGEGDLIVDTEGTNHLDLTAYSALTAASLEVTQYQAPDGEAYLNLHVRDDLNPGVTPATGGVSVQRGELGNFATVTVNDGAGGTVTLTHAQLMAQYAAQGFVYDGSAAAETLTGTSFADTMFGGAGADTISANAGDDRIDGGAGNDALSGGAGNDTYLLAFNGGRDTVMEDGAAEPNAVHTVQLDAGIASAMVKATRVGNDLEVQLRATSDALVLKDFYLQPQSWQDGWQVRDIAGATSSLASFIPVTPPPAATWLDEEKDVFRARREQVYGSNRQAEGYSALGGNVYQRTEQVFDYAVRASSGSTTTRQLIVQSQSSDAAVIFLDTSFTGTVLPQTGGSFDIGLPHVRGADGARGEVASGFGGTGSNEFVPVGTAMRGMSGAGVALNPGDYAVPVYAPRTGSAGGVRNAGSTDYANAGSYNNTSQWELVGYQIVRAGSGGGGEPGRVAATATYSNFDQRLTVPDLVAGVSDNVITAEDASLIEAGAGDDQVFMRNGFFFAGPAWEEALGVFVPFGSFVTDFGPRENGLGGFVDAGAGNDTVHGSNGQDTIAGGDGTDAVDGKAGSDRYLYAANESGIDALADSGLDAFSYLDWYYWNQGILNWAERFAHPDEWRGGGTSPGAQYFATEEEAIDFVENNDISQEVDFIAPLPAPPAPLLTRNDTAALEQLVNAGVLDRDVIEFGPGLTLADLSLTVTVNVAEAADHPEQPWYGGGTLAVRWGSAGFDVEIPDVNYGFVGTNLLTDGATDSGDEDLGSWRGYRLGEGIEVFQFADGTTYSLEQVLQLATVVQVVEPYHFFQNSGVQLIDRDYEAIVFEDFILSSDVAISRDGVDLLLTNSDGSQGRIPGWYADPANMPTTTLRFPFDPFTPEISAQTVTDTGLVVIGTDNAVDFLQGLDGFNDTLIGLGGDDVLLGGAGDDTLQGDMGQDTLVGGAGKDTYLFNSGDGVDAISDVPAGATDASVIVLGPNVFLSQVQFAAGVLVLDLGEGDAIRFSGFNPEDPFATRLFDHVEFGPGFSITFEDALDGTFDVAGTEGDDVLTGTPMMDRIRGAGGNDTLLGREGDDQLEGGSGKDTYVFNRGDGVDLITDAADDALDASVVVLGPDLFLARLHVAPDTLVLELGIAAQNGSEEIHFGAFDAEDPFARPVFDRLQFADGTSMTYQEVLAQGFDITGTDGNDVLTGTALLDSIHGAGGSDTLLGRADNDLLDGGAGDDVLDGGTGDDQLEGGAGNDVLDGGTGADFLVGGEDDDTYVYGRGDGRDVVSDNQLLADNPGTLDTVSFRAGVFPSEVRVSSDPHGQLYFTIVDSGDRLRVDESLGEQGRIERAVFADGTVWDRTVIETRIVQEPATPLGDVITGTGNDDVLDALGGDDELYGVGGNDILAGGEGNDFLEGNTGNNLLLGGAGNDHALTEDVTDGRNLFIGGPGNDFSSALADNMMLAFNAGDEQDSVFVITGKRFTISLGGGADAADIRLSNLGFDFLIEIGALDTINIGFLYTADSQFWPVTTLQIIGADIRTYDLNAVVVAYNAARAQDPGLIHWSGADALAANLLSMSTTEALGGAIAYQYATAGNLNDLSTAQQQAVLADANFGVAPQAVSATQAIQGTNGNDVLTGTAGDDTLVGGLGSDFLDGGQGSDTYVFNVGDGVDTIADSGTIGTDTVAFGAGITTDALSLGLGSLLVRVGANGDAIHIEGFDPDNALNPGSVEQFSFADGTVLTHAQLVARGFDLTGTAGDDFILGTSVVDRIDGGAGDDTLIGGAGNDTLTGDVGNDLYLFDPDFGQDVVADSDATAGNVDTIRFGAAITPGSVVVSRSGLNLVLTRSTDSATVQNWFGSDADKVEQVEFLFDGTAWNAAQLRGFSNLAPTVANPIADQTASADAAFSFTVPADTFADGDATIGDTLTYDATLANGLALPSWLSFSVATREISGTPTSEDVGTFEIRVLATDEAGAQAADEFDLTVTMLTGLTITGTSAADVLIGGAGADTISGLGGNDQLYGNEGNDTLLGGDGADQLFGWTGNDTLRGGNGNDTLYGDDGDDTLYGEANADTLWGWAGNDTLYGGDGNDTLGGDEGDDFLYGEANADVLYGWTGNDYLSGGLGNDQLSGEDGHDI